MLDVHRFRLPVTGILSFKERRQFQDVDATTKVLVNKEVDAPDFLVRLGLVKPDEKLIYLVRQRIVDGEAVILDKDYIRKSTIGDLPTNRVEESLYEYLEKDLGIKISYGNKDFKIEPVNEEDTTYIDLNGHKYIAVLRSDVYTEGTDFLHYTESRHRVDKFYFSEFARRKSDIIN